MLEWLGVGPWERERRRTSRVERQVRAAKDNVTTEVSGVVPLSMCTSAFFLNSTTYVAYYVPIL